MSSRLPTPSKRHGSSIAWLPRLVLAVAMLGTAVTRANTISTVAGNGTPGYGGDSGQAASAELNYPGGIIVDGGGNLYIADSNNNRVRRVATDGTISTIVGNGTGGYGGDYGPPTGAELNQPTGIALAGNGYLYIADKRNNRVRVVFSNEIVTIVGNGTPGYGGDGGLSPGAELDQPSGIVVAGSSLYIADTANNRVRNVSFSGLIGTIAGNGTAGYGGDGGSATSAQLNQPSGIAVDGAGNLYIADTTNNRVRRLAANGAISTAAGNGTGGYGGDGGSATGAQLNQPSAITFDGSGNLYIADTANNRVRKVAINGTISTVAGSGAQGYGGDGGPATNAQLNRPSGVAVDGAGNLYIADTGNSRIRKVTPGYSVGGNVSGLAGSGLTLSLDGGAQTLPIGANGSFVFPTALADGTAYSVSVQTQPASPVQTCAVNNASGTIAGADIANVAVICTTAAVATITMLSANPNPVMAGQSATLTISVGAASATPTGNATVVDADSSASCSAMLHAGTTTCTLTFAAAGTHHLTATYSGDVGFAGSSGTAILVVNAASTYTVGGNVTGLASASNVVLGLNASAQILLINANGSFAFPTALANGAGYSVQVQTQPASSAQICTVSNGSGTIEGADVTNVTVICTSLPPATTTVTLEASSTHAVFGQNIQLIAKIGIAVAPASRGYTVSAAAAPSGQVTFADGAVALGSAPVVGGGATFSIASLAVGAHGLTATYSGDANFAPSTSAPLNVVILAPSPGTTVTAPMLAPSWLAALAAALCLAAAGRARRTNSSTKSIERMATGVHAEIQRRQPTRLRRIEPKRA